NPPGIKVLDIAATKGYLYAITSGNGVDLGNSGYYRLKADGEWEPIPSPPNHPYPNAIYGTEDALFVAAARGSYYAVYALKDGDQTFTSIWESDTQGNEMLVGAAKWDNAYFISLEGRGVFRLDSIRGINDTDLVPGSTGKGNFTGLIEIDNALLMVSTSGVICKLSSASESVTDANRHSLDFGFTGALAVWHDPSDFDNKDKRLLLLGRKGSNTNYSGYGYYECQIPGGFDVKTLGIIEPLYTVEKNASYKNSLGKRAINSIIQAPDGIIFASTQSYNLWACRGGVWNYE
ncbi:MAG: hypothetical protein LBI91_03410, partial [Spirochaetaceae bacterium]|nr:hypothetical protein [Spirochaetaceae bacterium]